MFPIRPSRHDQDVPSSDITAKLLRLTVLLALLAVGRAAPAVAAVRLDAEKMKVALRTASREEDGFIDRVLVLVERRTLSHRLVDATFQWARRKQRRKFQHFKRAMIVLAARRGVRIPAKIR